MIPPQPSKPPIDRAEDRSRSTRRRSAVDASRQAGVARLLRDRAQVGQEQGLAREPPIEIRPHRRERPVASRAGIQADPGGTVLVAQRQRLDPVADGPGRGQQAAAIGTGLRSRRRRGAVRHPPGIRRQRRQRGADEPELLREVALAAEPAACAVGPGSCPSHPDNRRSVPRCRPTGPARRGGS